MTGADPSPAKLEVWQQVVEVEADRVTSQIQYRFTSSGDELVSTHPAAVPPPGGTVGLPYGHGTQPG